MAKIAFPSEGAVGSIYGSPTNIARERILCASIAGHPVEAKAHVISGFAPSVGGSNSVIFAYGSGGHLAIINGTIISFDADISITGLSNATHFIYAQLTKVDGLVTDWSLVSNTTGVVPTDAVALAHVVVTGGVAGSLQSAKILPGFYQGSYVGDNESSRVIFLGWRPAAVRFVVPGAMFVLCRDTDLSFKISGTSSPNATYGATMTNHAIIETGFTVGLNAAVGYNYFGETYKYIVSNSGAW